MRNKNSVHFLHKLLELVTAIFFLALLVITMAGFFSYNSTWLKQKVVTMLVQSGADFCTIEGIVLVPYKSITLNKLVVVERGVDTLRQDTVHIDQVYFEGNMLSLLLHRKRLMQELLVTNGDLFSLFATKPAAAVRSLQTIIQRECTYIKLGRCSGIAGAVKVGTEQYMHLKDGILQLQRVEKGEVDNWEASVTLPAVRVGFNEFKNVRGQLLLAKEGKQLSCRWRGDYLGGKVNGSAIFNLKKSALKSTSLMPKILMLVHGTAMLGFLVLLLVRLM